VALLLPLPGAAKAGAQASGSHVGSALLQALVGKQTAASVCDKKKPASQAKCTTSPVVPLPLPDSVPFSGATKTGAHDSASHVGSTLLQALVGKQTNGLAWLNAYP
jgi:hypothetical protein